MSVDPLPSAAPPEGQGEDLPVVVELLQLLRDLGKRHDLGKASPEWQGAVARLLDSQWSEPGRLRLVGRARKISISMPEDLTAAVQQRVGRGEFSQYVTEAVARQLERDFLGELAAMLEAEYGPVPEAALAEARHAWPDGD